MSESRGQNKTTESIFEVVGSYFTDTIYNHIYASAQKHLGRGASLTDEYVRHLQAYVIGVKNDKSCYAKTVQGVHNFFMVTTRFSTMSFADFVNRVVGVCVPEEYFTQFTNKDKDEILSSVLCDLVSNLATFAARPEMLRRIIDQHSENSQVTVGMMQDHAVSSLFNKRAHLQNMFLKKVSQARETVSVDQLEEMKAALRRLVKEKAAETARANAAEEEFTKLKASARIREAKLLKLVELLRAGQEKGPAAAGAALLVPAANNIAESKLAASVSGRVPPRDRLGEAAPSDGTYSESGSSRGSAKKPAAPKPPAVAASFFTAKPAVSAGFFAAPAGLPAAPAKKPAPKPAASIAASVSASTAPSTAASVAPSTGPSALVSRLFADPTGDDEMDSILGFAE